MIDFSDESIIFQSFYEGEYEKSSKTYDQLLLMEADTESLNMAAVAAEHFKDFSKAERYYRQALIMANISGMYSILYASFILERQTASMDNIHGRRACFAGARLVNKSLNYADHQRASTLTNYGVFLKAQNRIADAVQAFKVTHMG
jgi:Tfp pilus assembly protein PilF